MFEVIINKDFSVAGYEGVFSWECPMCGLKPLCSLHKAFFCELVTEHLLRKHLADESCLNFQIREIGDRQESTAEGRAMHFTQFVYSSPPDELHAMISKEIKRQLDAREGMGA